MSRVASKTISLEGVKLKHFPEKEIIEVTGEKGSLQIHAPSVKNLVYRQEDNKLFIEGEESNLAIRGTMVRIISNAVNGVKKHFIKEINIVGIGYKCVKEGNCLEFSLGFSHTKKVEIDDNVNVECKSKTQLIVSSCDKWALGSFVAKLSRLRKYNVYKGKGLIVKGHFYRRKESVKKK